MSPQQPEISDGPSQQSDPESPSAVTAAALSPRVETLQLNDGRTLSYYQYHAAQDAARALPVVFIHGFPGSGLQGRIVAPYFLAVGCPVIAPDRPGFGGSTDKAERTFGDWAVDLRALLDHLEIPRCQVMAISGGAPYGLAAAAVLPDRVVALTVVSGVGELDRPAVWTKLPLGNRVMIQAAGTWPRAARVLATALVGLWRMVPLSVGLWMWLAVDSSDRRLLTQPRQLRFLLRDLRAALAQGTAGVVAELFRLARPWGLDLKKISVPVQWWHGLSDRYVPWECAQETVKQIPAVDVRQFLDGGHFMIMSRARDVVRPLALPRVTLLFGLSGVGKSFVGGVLGRMTGVYVYEADDDLTEEMREALTHGTLFTSAMLDDYFSQVTVRILNLLAVHQHLIVTQAVYKQSRRDALSLAIPGLEPVWVTAPDEMIAARIRARGGAVTEQYAQEMRTRFEAPLSATKAIVNDGDIAILQRRLRHLFR